MDENCKETGWEPSQKIIDKVGVCKASSLKTKIQKIYYLLQKLEIL